MSCAAGVRSSARVAAALAARKTTQTPIHDAWCNGMTFPPNHRRALAGRDGASDFSVCEAHSGQSFPGIAGLSRTSGLPRLRRLPRTTKPGVGPAVWFPYDRSSPQALEEDVADAASRRDRTVADRQRRARFGRFAAGARASEPARPGARRLDAPVPEGELARRARGGRFGTRRRGLHGAVARLQGEPHGSARSRQRLQQAVDRLHRRVRRRRRRRGRRRGPDAHRGHQGARGGVGRGGPRRHAVSLGAPRSRPLEDPRQGVALSRAVRPRGDRPVYRTQPADPRRRVGATAGDVDGGRTGRPDGGRRAAGREAGPRGSHGRPRALYREPRGRARGDGAAGAVGRLRIAMARHARLALHAS